MENHFSLKLIVDVLDKNGWDCIGGLDMTNAQGLVALDGRVKGYGLFAMTGDNPTNHPELMPYMREKANTLDDMWDQAHEAIQTLNEVCKRTGLPQYLPEDRTEAHAIILSLLKQRMTERIRT